MPTKVNNNLPTHISIKIDYDKYLVLPYTEGSKVIECLSKVEILKKSYGNPSKLRAIEDEDLPITLISGKEYKKLLVESTLSEENND